MGNCVGNQTVVSWADEEEEWEWADNSYRELKTKTEDGHQPLHRKSVPRGALSTEVKIKITKKQLEEVLRKVDAHGLPMQEVLAHLMSGASDVDDLSDRASHWRPALRSIPEAAES